MTATTSTTVSAETVDERHPETVTSATGAGDTMEGVTSHPE